MAIPLPKPFTPNNYTILSLTKHSPKLTTTFAFSSGRKLIESGSVQQITAKDASSLIENEGFQLLDIRPEWEREKAFVRGSLHVPLFVKEEDSGPITLLKKWVHFGYIGLWTGQLLTTINEKFLREVEELVPDKEEKLIVACGEGLRSLMAVKRLHENGYQNLGWLAGGFNRTMDTDFPVVVGATKLQYATIGGASYYFLQLLLLFQSIGK
ncbi:rhodanese-like domain-containing protein 10 isoform X1 [Amborella trichopoda]|uniref:rhodanese-like domain-containing protein 10 isoform X1 n=2 Tax=Amborella trichopoda TaxID=13333 RepID=UPI0005D3B446|nr:rhodanese-like domain-containing protein 10 isoform X1 [Amborella trichopoda]|eukprot:XP_006843555.2 rhodanese-like domain-containing protein 10 isoform X1 [Amborella trichopoda]